ncbi:MAG: PAS domain S-box protein [Cyanobacteria bacterium CRU_2_1]|nr:PAS domain S-box protein [Cyanobacteria bacterium CRU_2_1]
MKRSDRETFWAIEALRHTSVIISFYTLDGAPLMLNSSAIRCYGDLMSSSVKQSQYVTHSGSPSLEKHRNLSKLDNSIFLQRFVDLDVKHQVITQIQIQEDFSLDAQVITLAGIRWHRLDVQHISDPLTSKPVLLVTESDISIRKRMEESLRQSEERWQMAIESNYSGIWDWDITTNETFRSARCQEVLGYEDHEMGSSNDEWSSRLHPDDYDRVIAENQAYLTRQTPSYATEYRLRCKDGSYKWVQVRGIAQWDAEGRPVRMVGSTEDITDRKALEQELALREAQFNAFFTYAPVGMIICDRQMQYVQVNEFAAHLNNLSAPAHIGKSIREVSPHLAPIEELIHQQILDTGKPILNLEFSGEVPNQLGVLKIWLASYFPISDLDNYPTHVGCVFVEISDLRRIEQELIRHQILREAIFNESTDALFLVDTETLLTLDCNRRAIELFEASHKDELINIEGQTLQYQQFLPEELDAITEQINTKRFWSQEIEYVTKKANTFWGNLAAKQINILGGTINLVRVTDISDRKQAEQSLKASQERFRNLIETTNDWVWEIDENFVYTYVSPKVFDILGYIPEEVLGKTPFDLMPSEEVDRVSIVFGTMFANRQCLTYFEMINIHKQGHKINLEMNGIPFSDINGIFRGYRGINRDITQRKQVENEILRSLQQEKELNELKSRFVSMISHEIRTPLTTIQSSAELLEFFPCSDVERQELFCQIRVSVKYMIRLLEEVLFIGRADSGTIEVRATSINLAQFCQSLITEFELNLERQCLIIFNFQMLCHDEAFRCHLDEKLLRQILYNLLSNAIKYSPGGHQVKFDVLCQKHQAIFQIQDQGIGIPEEDKHRLFQFFYRAKNVGTIPGTGLGLSIVKRCVDLCQGTIAVESEVGRGTTFTVTLPLNSRELGNEDRFSN